ncbi:MAG: cytochrome c-type biogenesis protein CcmH [Nannocystaceae bacterium]
MQSPQPQGPSSEAEELVIELSHDLMSPYCPGRTIATCPSPQARKLENEMLVKAEAGMSREEIESELVARFPDIQGYVGRPEILWGTAVAAILAIAALALAARRWIRQGRDAGLPSAPGSAPTGASGPASAINASQREIDALEDALDDVDDF